MGLGALAYAVAKADGQLHTAESRAIRELLDAEPFGDVARCAFTLKEFQKDSPEEAYQFALRYFQANRRFMDRQRRFHFLRIARTIADAHDNTSDCERALLDRLKDDLDAL